MALRRLVICARCLHDGRPLIDDHPDDPRHRTAAGAAITIDDGQAICLDHWREQHELHVDLDG